MYANAYVGKNSLSSFMSDISNVGKHSKVYRNHSVRATSITVLDVVGISGRHIMKVSGHRLETQVLLPFHQRWEEERTIRNS